MRIAEGKEYCLYLDHAGNMAGWFAEVSDIWANGVSELPSEKKEKPQRKEGKERESTVCHECRFVMSPQATECLHCGAAKRARKSQAKTAPGRMGEVERPSETSRMASQPPTYGASNAALPSTARARTVEAARKFAVAQYRNMTGQWPSRGMGVWSQSKGQRTAVVGAVKRNLIAYFKGKAA